MSSFGLLLKNKRLEMELTLAQLEELTGVSSSYINRIENGINNQPSYENVINIADALGISDEEIRNCYKSRIKQPSNVTNDEVMKQKLRTKEVNLEFSIASKEGYLKLYEKYNNNELYDNKSIKKTLEANLLSLGCSTINELNNKLKSEKGILKEVRKELKK